MKEPRDNARGSLIREVVNLLPFQAAQTTLTLRPTRRLRFIICRPFFVRIRARNPTLRTRLVLLTLCG